MPKCKAKSLRTGKPCTQWAIRGATVCKMHGGKAPQVKQRAEERLAALVDPALGVLASLLRARSEGVRLQSVKDILDRAGYKATERIESSGKTVIEIEYVGSGRPERPGANGKILESG